MNSQDTSSQIQSIEAAIEKLTAKPVVPADGTTNASAAQSMQKENLQSLKQDLMHQVKLNQDQMIKDQMEQARLRSELAYKEQLQQSRALQEQTQRDREAQAKLRREQIERYEQQQAKLKQDQFQRDQLEQSKRRQEQMQRDREQQARLKQEQLQREQQLQARLKQEQMQREKAKQEQIQIQKERAQQERAKQEQIQIQKNIEDQRNLILAQRLKEERNRLEELKSKTQGKDSTGDKKDGKDDLKNPKTPKTPEQLAKDEEARAFSSRTEMSLASIAFCSPLMLFGMGAAMSIFDNFAGGRKNLALLDARRKNQQNMELSEYARLEADKKFNEMVERNNLINKSSVTDVNATKFGQAMKGTERKEEKPRVNRFVAAEAPPMPAARKNDSLEVKKLWKERQRLLEHLERVRGQGSLALVSKLVSQLETLDRSLKRLGCDPQA